MTISQRFDADILVVGDTLAAFTAALTARKAGRQVMLVAAGTAVAEELTVCLCGDIPQETRGVLQQLSQRIEAAGGRVGDNKDWLDGAIAELVSNRLLEEHGIELLLYATPISLVLADDAAGAVLFGGKDGFFSIGAASIVDATRDGALFRQSGLPFKTVKNPPAVRTAFFEFATADAPQDPQLHRTWPDELCLIASAEELWEEVSLLRQREPALANAVLSHTGHRPLPLGGDHLATPVANGMHPGFPNVFGAGPWLANRGWGSLALIAASGEAAGYAAARIHLGAALPCPVAELPEALRMTTDVVVAGGGTGGILAALAAADHGANVCLLEASPVLGGIGTGGGIHCYYHGVAGGLQDLLDADTRERSQEIGTPKQTRGFSPEAKKAAIETSLTSRSVTILRDTVVVDVIRQGSRVTGVLAVQAGKVIQLDAAVVIDATGDADVAARAGAEFMLGRAWDGVDEAFSVTPGVRNANHQCHGFNFDAGYVDATDIIDLTRARRLGVGHLWKDEAFTAETRWSYISPLLGLRESRRVIGDYVLTFEDQILQRTFSDVIAYGRCHYDNHAVDYQNESDEAIFWCWGLGFWSRHMRHGLPYRSLLPRGVDGLLVACRALSQTHDAAMLFRMQRDMQRVGEAAGIAAALAVRHAITPREVDIQELQEKLRASGALIDDWQSGIDESSVEEMITQLDCPEGTLAVWQLMHLGEEAKPRLLALLDAGTPHQRWWAATILAMNGRPEAAPVLLDALAKRDATVPLPASEQAPGYFQLVRLKPRWITAIVLLGRIASRDAVAPLAELLTEPVEADQAEIMIAAVRALGRIGDRAAVPALQRFAERDDLPAARPKLYHANQWIAERVQDELAWQFALAAANALTDLGEPATQYITPCLDHHLGYVRKYAASLMERQVGEPVPALAAP